MPNRRQTLLLAAAVVLCCCAVAPLEAQVPTTPPPTTSSLVSELSNAVEANGAFAAVLMGVVVIMAGVVVFLIMSVRVGLKPLLEANANASNRAQDSQRAMVDMQQRVLAWQEEQYRREEQVAQTRHLQANALERTAALMTEIETRNEATSGRSAAVGVINAHTTASVDGLKASIDEARKDVQAIQATLEAKASRTDLENGLKPILEHLAAITHSLDRNLEAIRVHLPETPSTLNPAPTDTSGKEA